MLSNHQIPVETRDVERLNLLNKKKGVEYFPEGLCFDLQEY